MILPGRPDREVLAMTAWAEADMLGTRGMQATLNTVQNRMRSGVVWWGKTLREICLFVARGSVWHQYSCWNGDNPRLPAILGVTPQDPAYAVALELADAALAGKLRDVTHGATHYYNHKLVPKPPRWALTKDPCYKLEPHWYYCLPS